MTTFISYSTKDEETAKKLVKTLEENGVKCFYAPRDIEPGTEYATEIIKAIKELDCVTLIFSSSSNASMYVLREINSAVLNNKVIIPFKVDDATPTESMEFYLGATHWLNAYPEISDTVINSLIKAICQTHKEKSCTEKEICFETPTMLDAEAAEPYGYSISRIAMETIQLDYLALSGNQYLINDEIEGTVEDWIDMFTNYPDLYSMLFYRNQMIGYWLMEMIEDEHYDSIISGEKIINAQMQEFYDFGGDFCCYVAIMPLIKKYENSANYLALFGSFFDRLVAFAENGINTKKIGISVYSALQEQIVKKLGFVFKGTNPANGKVYELTPDAIAKNNVIKQRYPRFFEMYSEGDKQDN